jgi:hypothetical protein
VSGYVLVAIEADDESHAAPKDGLQTRCGSPVATRRVGDGEPSCGYCRNSLGLPGGPSWTSGEIIRKLRES